MRYYGGGVGHTDPRKLEETEADSPEVGDEGIQPDHIYEDMEGSSNDTDDDDSDSRSDSGGDSDGEGTDAY